MKSIIYINESDPGIALNRLSTIIIILILPIYLISLSVEAIAQPAPTSPTVTTVLLVRHAEKMNTGVDPPLTAEGRVRAQSLYHLVAKADVDAIFASTTKRSQETVAPVFNILHSVKPSTKLSTYKPGNEKNEVCDVVLSQYVGKVVLIAAHSDTAKKIVGWLGGNESDCSIENEYEYHNLCVVNVYTTGKATVVSLQYGDPSPFRIAKVTLKDKDSYDFSIRAQGQYTGGDLYLRTTTTTKRFLANNVGQQGVKDVTGELIDKNLPLHKVNIPTVGYSRMGVLVADGHTYVSLAHKGEDGNYIIFRVTKVNVDSVDLVFLYSAK